MKKVSVIYLLGLVWLCSACSDWLTIRPETSVDAETLFGTETGIKQGLNGAYYIGTSLYAPTGYLGGSEFVEMMANTYAYSTTTGGNGYWWANHIYDYSDSQEEVNGHAFLKLYNVIANLNSLISEMAKSRDKVAADVYHIVRGEALAYRACCHLDILRIWGPVPAAADESRKYVPYVRVNNVHDYEYHTFDQFMDYVRADLDSAEIYLAQYDPVVTSTFASTESTSASWPYRKSRFNYYGVLGLQARAALWRGDKERALQYARMLKEATNEDGTPKFRLTTPADNVGDYTQTDLTHYSEHICGIKCEEFSVSSMSSPWAYRYLSCYNYEEYLKALYGENFKEDLRYQHFWKSGSGSWEVDPETGQYVYVVSSYTINRYSDFESHLASPHNFSIIRLPEIYFILMEYAALQEANELYEEYCAARGITYVPLSEDDRQERMILESIREYVAEGQNFFTYKRNDVRRMVGATTDCTTDQYMLPIPEAEYSGVK